jgi:hypothetical protein
MTGLSISFGPLLDETLRRGAQVERLSRRAELLDPLPEVWIAASLPVVANVGQRAEAGGAKIVVLIVVGNDLPRCLFE